MKESTDRASAGSWPIRAGTFVVAQGVVAVTSGSGAILKRLAKKVWFRAALFTIAAVVLVLAAGLIAALSPYSLIIDVGQDSVGSVLQILASSMLAVTTFSLTTMVTAYSSATTTATPRATQLLVEDTTSQNALSTFIGGFTFSLVGIVALSTGYYDQQGRTVLFLGTLAMVVLIVVTLLRWIAHLSTFGRMADIIDRVESAASRTLNSYAETPTLGARAFSMAPSGAVTVYAETTGYVTFIDIGALDRCAKKNDVAIYVLRLAGTTADATHALVLTSAAVDDSAAKDIRSAFTIGSHRNYEQDPRLGVIALCEIGSRALSPGTNDPGTAIEVIASLQRVFAGVLERERADDVRYPRVYVRPVPMADLVTDAFRPLARDGAGFVEVQIRLQKCLHSLADLSVGRSQPFLQSAELAYDRARASLEGQDMRVLDEVCSTLRST